MLQRIFANVNGYRTVHNGSCDEDHDGELLKIIKAAGFQRCVCGYLVELTVGCYHMTCRCKRQFCYLCAKPWKTCSCPQFDEQRLLLRAHELDARADAAVAGLGDVPREERVAAIADHIRE